jgi:hypothetical protein
VPVTSVMAASSGGWHTARPVTKGRLDKVPLPKEVRPQQPLGNQRSRSYSHLLRFGYSPAFYGHVRERVAPPLVLCTVVSVIVYVCVLYLYGELPNAHAIRISW